MAIPSDVCSEESFTCWRRRSFAASAGTTGLEEIGNPFRLKSPRIVWEYMPGRSRFQTADMHRQGEILAKIAKHCDAGTFPKLNSTHLGSNSAENLQKAHRQLASATTIGKVTLD